MTVDELLENDDIYFHDGNVFSKSDMITYLKQSSNFQNPVTRKTICLHDVARLEDPDLIKIFRSSVEKLQKLKDDQDLFFFLESEAPKVLRNEIEARKFVYDDDSCVEVELNDDEQEDFHDYEDINDSLGCSLQEMCSQMKKLDPNRAECVRKFLLQIVDTDDDGNAVTRKMVDDAFST